MWKPLGRLRAEEWFDVIHVIQRIITACWGAALGIQDEEGTDRIHTNILIPFFEVEGTTDHDIVGYIYKSIFIITNSVCLVGLSFL